MSLVRGVATRVFTEPNIVPLLPELVPSEDGGCYKHGAPTGAVPKPALPHSEQSKICPATRAAQLLMTLIHLHNSS